MPRLFVAINLPKEITEALYKGVLYLRDNSLSANPSRKENLHLTLAFIGETPKVNNAISALKSINVTPFEITLAGVGAFSSKEGKLCFAKAKESSSLSNAATSVRGALAAYGFETDPKPFKPHITLCRQFAPSSSYKAEELCTILPETSFPVGEISLMLSERINGRLVYTEVFKKIL